MSKFRKKPVVIEAVQWLGDNHPEVTRFQGGCAEYEGDKVVIQTLEGEMRASVGDWIIKGVNGEFYPCKPDIFAMTYEEVKE